MYPVGANMAYFGLDTYLLPSDIFVVPQKLRMSNTL